MNTENDSTMKCEEVVELFGDYVDGDLCEPVKERVEKHIASCSKCQDFEKSYRFVIELAASLRPRSVEMPVEAKNRLRAALNEKLGLSLPTAY